MQNLPDDELFNALENRLRNYSEEPDDEVWRRISAVHPGSTLPSWIMWTNRTAAVFALAAVFFILYDQSQEEYNINKLLLSHSVKGKDPSLADTTKASLSGISDNPVEQNELFQDKARKNTELKKSGAVEPSEKTISSALQPDAKDNNISTGLADEIAAVHAALIVEPVEEMPEDTVHIEQTVFKDTIAGPAREEEEKKKEKHKRTGITFYTSLAPSLSYYRVSPLSGDDVVIEKLNSPGILSADRLGINLEAGIQGKITKRLEYIAGISFYYQSQRITYEQLTSDNVIVEKDADKSYLVRPGVLRKSFEYDMQNMGAQAGLLYTLKQEGLLHKTGIMLHYQKGLQKSSDADVYDNANSNALSYQIIYRLEYAFRPRFNFFIQPAYMHSFYNDESIHAPFRLKQSRAGIGIGVVYDF